MLEYADLTIFFFPSCFAAVAHIRYQIFFSAKNNRRAKKNKQAHIQKHLFIFWDGYKNNKHIEFYALG